MDTYGKFDPDLKEYRIDTPQTPRPWLNYLWNECFLARTSQLGEGEAFSQDERGNRIYPVQSRMLYLRDCVTGDWEPLNRPPNTTGKDEGFCCAHGLGYSRIERRALGLRSVWRNFVPLEDALELWTVELGNEGERAREWELVFYANPKVDNEYGHQGYYTRIIGRADAETGAVWMADRDKRTFLLPSVHPEAYDTRWTAFIGHHGNEMAPQVMQMGKILGNSECEFEKSVLATAHRVRLEPGERRTWHAAVGVLPPGVRPAEIAAKYFGQAVAVERAYEAAVSAARKVATAVRWESGPEGPGDFYSVWLARQLHFNATWARGYFNGFRDLCQDIENFTIVDTDHSRLRLHTVLEHQYASGHAPRAWLGGKVVETNTSDSAVWLIPAIRAELFESGDFSLLEERVAFYDGGPATVYEHARRSLDYLWDDRGLHGLCRIHERDWNDVIDRLGIGGEGVSVWLSMALVHSLKQFAELADLSGAQADAAGARERAAVLSRTINEVAWEDDHYLRGWSDAGRPLGTSADTEAQVFLNPQTWAVISGVADADRAATVMATIEETLRCEFGYRQLAPCFQSYREEVGTITAQRPGAYQNGSVYLHANAFKVVADCLLGRAEAAAETYERILPGHPAHATSDAEPYVVPNAWFAPEAGYRAGSAGQSWITGTAGWLFNIVSRWFYGIEPRPEGLRLRPCLPEKWQESRFERRVRGTLVRVAAHKGGGGGQPSVEIDGMAFANGTIPWERLSGQSDLQIDLKY